MEIAGGGCWVPVSIEMTLIYLLVTTDMFTAELTSPLCVLFKLFDLRNYGHPSPQDAKHIRDHCCACGTVCYEGFVSAWWHGSIVLVDAPTKGTTG